MNKKWYDGIDFAAIGSSFDFNIDSLALPTLLRKVLDQHGQNIESSLFEYSERGKINKGDDDIIITFLKKFEAKLLYKVYSTEYRKTLWMWDAGMALIYANDQNDLHVEAYSLNENLIKLLSETVNPLFIEEISQGSVYAITSYGGGLSLENIGYAGIEVIRNNYMPDVIEKYDFIIQELNTASPTGRITIIEGEPGVGKSFLIRGLLMEVPDVMFVLISPDMVSSLGNPELLPLLLRQKINHSGPIVLILEDADQCLVVRGSDNMSSIQSLLNLGDGILGSLLDIRIIATTNAKKIEMEKAILRPGRLSTRLEVSYLDRSAAENVYKSLLPEKSSDTMEWRGHKMSLANVYLQARKNGWVPPVRNNSKNTSSSNASPVAEY